MAERKKKAHKQSYISKKRVKLRSANSMPKTQRYYMRRITRVYMCENTVADTVNTTERC